MLRWTSTGTIRILDFDIETRKVGFHNGGKFGPDGCEPITIAACWVDTMEVKVWLQPQHTLPEMLAGFLEMYDAAEMVTGHYVRKFDLPIITGALLEHGKRPLGRKLVCDTKCDLIDFAGLSKSQENLGAMLALAEAKYHMNDHRWRSSSRLDPDGVKEATVRACEDVRQHMALRSALAAAGALRAPRVWDP